MTALSVNLNKIALIRNSRAGSYPSVTEHATICLDAGADGITIHPRPDQRHIRASDARELRELLNGVELNIEGNPFAGPRVSGRDDVSDYPGFMQLVRECRPEQCTLVPDGDAQLTSDHGFNMARDGERLKPIITELRELGIRVSVFMDPDPAQMPLVAAAGAHRIELYTGPYAAAHADGEPVGQILQPYIDTAQAALDCGLGVNAGHDLNLDNLADFARVPGLDEVSIGHALTVDAIRMGLAIAIRQYLNRLGRA